VPTDHFDYERKARDFLMEKGRARFTRHVSRALEILSHRSKISSEGDDALSVQAFRMGVNLGLID